MEKWRIIAIICLVASVGLLVLAGYTLVDSQESQLLPWPEIWMSNVLGTLSVLFGLGWTVGGAWCVTLGFAVLLAVATLVVCLVPQMVEAVANVRSDLRELDAFRARGFKPWGGWKLRDIIFFPALGVAMLDTIGIFVNIWSGKTAMQTLPLIVMFFISGGAAPLSMPKTDKSSAPPPQTAEVLRPRQFRRSGNG